MAEVPVEVKKASPGQTTVPDVWRSFRSEMDRVFDRFAGGFGFPSPRRMLDIEPAWHSAASFSFSAPAIDMSEDDKAYKISAELQVSMARTSTCRCPATCSSSKARSARRRRKRTRTIIFPSAPMVRSSVRTAREC